MSATVPTRSVPISVAFQNLSGPRCRHFDDAFERHAEHQNLLIVVGMS